MVFLIDRSGSMISIKEDMEGGIKEFLKKQKEIEGDCTITVAEFDTEFSIVHRKSLLREVEQITINPRGGTALIDSMVKLIDQVGKDLAILKESQRPEKVLFITVTDGEENSSHEFKNEDLKKRLEIQENQYKWQFVYLGANQDAFSVAQNIGISNFQGKGSNFKTNSKAMFNAYASLSSATARYRSGTSGEDFSFTTAEQASMNEE
jgi:uncharacterized protein YegL